MKKEAVTDFLFGGLFSKFDGCNLHHLTDGQVIGTSGFTDAAAHTIGCMLGHSAVAALGPIAQTVAGQVTLKEEDTGNGNAFTAGSTVIAAAAELGAQIPADGGDFVLFGGGQGRYVIHGSQVLIQFLGFGHTGNDNGN